MRSTRGWRAAPQRYGQLASLMAVVSALWWLVGAAFAVSPVSAMTGSVYVGDLDGNTFSQFGIGAGELLSELSPATVENEANSFSLAASPDGKSVYVADKDGNVSEYSVGVGGLLSAKSPASVPAGGHTWSVAVSPNGENVYVADNEEAKISQYNVGAGGVLEPKSPQTVKTGVGPWGIAVSPNGESVYVADDGEDKISQYSVGAGGVLEPKSPAQVLTGASPDELAISPNGASVYVADEGESKIAQYNVGAGGLLEPKALGTVSTGASTEPEGIVVSPDGTSVYTGDQNGDISQLSVGAGGSLEPKSPLTVASALGAPTLAITPDGKTLYAANLSSSSPGEEVSQFAIGADGLLSLKAPATIGSTPGAHGIVVLPDPGPVASFTATSGLPGSATSFNASESSDADGAVVLYDWSFGDGDTAANGGVAPSHTYAIPGIYTVTLTVTDEAGCSTTLVFTGRTAYCAADVAATTTRTVIVPPPPALVAAPVAPTLSHLAETAKTWREGNALAQISGAGTSNRKKRPPLGTTFSFVLNESASVVFTFTEPAAGRRVGKRCVAQTGKNKHKPHCTRTVTAGAFTFSAHAGINKVRFEGLISKHTKLKPGSYTLLVSATASGKRSSPATLHFTVANG
jgi:DNA-binding beta-propeller fold protein YncE